MNRNNTDWDQAIAEVVEDFLGKEFDSHQVILELAHRNQRRYVAALAELDTDTPFQEFHSVLGRRIKHVCNGYGLIGLDDRSPDMFRQNNSCVRYERVN